MSTEDFLTQVNRYERERLEKAGRRAEREFQIWLCRQIESPQSPAAPLLAELTPAQALASDTHDKKQLLDAVYASFTQNASSLGKLHLKKVVNARCKQLKKETKKIPPRDPAILLTTKEKKAIMEKLKLLEASITNKPPKERFHLLTAAHRFLTHLFKQKQVSRELASKVIKHVQLYLADGPLPSASPEEADLTSGSHNNQQARESALTTESNHQYLTSDLKEWDDKLRAIALLAPGEAACNQLDLSSLETERHLQAQQAAELEQSRIWQEEQARRIRRHSDSLYHNRRYIGASNLTAYRINLLRKGSNENFNQLMITHPLTEVSETYTRQDKQLGTYISHAAAGLKPHISSTDWTTVQLPPLQDLSEKNAPIFLQRLVNTIDPNQQASMLTTLESTVANLSGLNPEGKAKIKLRSLVYSIVGSITEDLQVKRSALLQGEPNEVTPADVTLMHETLHLTQLLNWISAVFKAVGKAHFSLDLDNKNISQFTAGRKTASTNLGNYASKYATSLAEAIESMQTYQRELTALNTADKLIKAFETQAEEKLERKIGDTPPRPRPSRDAITPPRQMSGEGRSPQKLSTSPSRPPAFSARHTRRPRERTGSSPLSRQRGPTSWSELAIPAPANPQQGQLHQGFKTLGSLPNTPSSYHPPAQLPLSQGNLPRSGATPPSETPPGPPTYSNPMI